MNRDTGTWHFFFRGENGAKIGSSKGKISFADYWKDRPAFSIALELPIDLSLEEALELAIASKGSIGSQRSGIFEIQSPLGIWSHSKGRRIDSQSQRNVSFRSWEELSEEEGEEG